MTARQVLMEYIARLTEEEAAARLPLMRDAGTPPPLTSEQIEEVERAVARLDAGQKTSHAEMKRRFGIS